MRLVDVTPMRGRLRLRGVLELGQTTQPIKESIDAVAAICSQCAWPNLGEQCQCQCQAKRNPIPFAIHIPSEAIVRMSIVTCCNKLKLTKSVRSHWSCLSATCGVQLVASNSRNRLAQFASTRRAAPRLGLTINVNTLRLLIYLRA